MVLSFVQAGVGAKGGIIGRLSTIVLKGRLDAFDRISFGCVSNFEQ
jgi:hypothetical protein